MRQQDRAPCDGSGGLEEMDERDEKQMEGVHASHISRDNLPVTQVALSRCIVGRQREHTLLRLESRPKRESCGGAAVSSRGGGGGGGTCTVRHRSRKKTKRISERQITQKMEAPALLELLTVAQLSLAEH